MMKTFITLITFLVTCLAGYAQPSDAVALEDLKFSELFAKRAIPTVTGKLLHISAEDRSKTKISYSLVTLFGQVKKTADLAADGSFKLQLEYPLPYQQIWFDIENIFYGALYVNQDLHVELDFGKIKASGKEVNFNGDGVRYLGTDGPLTTYMNNYILFRRPEQLKLSSRIHSVPRSQNPIAEQVISAYRNIFDSLKLIQDDYAATHPSPYAWLLENERMSEYYSMIWVAYWGHTMESTLFDTLKTHKIYLISNNSTSYYQYESIYLSTQNNNNRMTITWQELAILPDLNDAEKAAIDLVRIAEKQPSTDLKYSEHLKQLWKPLNARMNAIGLTRRIEKSIRFLDSSFTPSRADILKLFLNQSKDLDDQKLGLALIMPSMQTNWCRMVAETEYALTVEKMAAVNKALATSGNSITATDFGKPLLQTAFGASLYKVSNVTGLDFLAKLRQSFPGKAIVFDRWATWCAPCLSEMPHSKKLQLESKDLPVLFVYVCTENGSSESKWKSKVAELNLPGVHFFIDETLDAELSKYFSFTGYPGYAFIDRKGVYKPGAITRVSNIKDRNALAELVND